MSEERSDRRSYRQVLPTLRRLLRLLIPYRSRMLLSLFLTGIAAVVPLATPRLIGIAVDQWNNGKFPESLLFPAIGILVVEVVSLILRHFKEYHSQTLVERMVFDLRCMLFARVDRLPASFYEKSPTGKLATRILDESRSVELHFLGVLSALVVAPVSLLGIVIVLSIIDWQLVLWAMLPVPLLYLLIALSARSIRRVGRLVRDRSESLSSTLHEQVGGIRTIQLLGGEEAEEHRFAGRAADYRSARREMANVTSWYYPALGLFMGMGTVIVLLYAVWSGSGREMTGGDIVSFIVYLGYLYGPLVSLSGANHALQEMALSAERIFEILDEQLPSEGSADVATDKTPEIECRGVSFAYHSGRDILKNISLTVRPGERIGIAGPTGAGKTTLARLLVRLYDPSEGRALLDGKELREYRLASLRKAVTLVDQEGFLFGLSIRENIRFGDPRAGEEDIRRIMALVRLEEVVRRHPAGMDAEIGERGVRLSAGERQRLSLARALLRDPRILVLDEATSALDIGLEREILSGIMAEKPERTTIVISHRPSALELCAKVYRLQDGGLAPD
ncbi:MAG: hypothetical protein A2Z34_08870 [Planctomycetes bacterium RBG_16_59_8]|nr:MAG: hypothetical protein A2Z34_08870 [Planctomycetes bacterium RBG_16_59_8]